MLPEFETRQSVIPIANTIIPFFMFSFCWTNMKSS